MKSKNTILRVNNLSKIFKTNGSLNKVVLNRINFEIKTGELLGLIGYSGSGKTTLIRTMLQLERPSSGEVFFGKTDISKLSSESLRKNVRPFIRMVYQHPEASLNPGLTVLQIIQQPYLLHYPEKNHRSVEHCIRLLNEMGLNESYLNKYQHELSGGEKRRVAMARALITKPKILIADEPLAGLDKALQYRMLSLLMKQKQEHNLTMMIVSHDVDVMLEICDRILVLNNAEIIENKERTNDVLKLEHPQSIELF